MNEHVVLQVPISGADYDADFSAWSRHQAELLRHRQLDLIDIENIAEEIENLARKERRSVEKRLRTLVEHLLKLQFFSLSDDPRATWQVTTIKTRLNLEATFLDNPSLFAQREFLFAQEWRKGAKLAIAGLPDDIGAAAAIRLIAETPLFSIDRALDPDFFPSG